MTVIKAGQAETDAGGQNDPLGPYRAEWISDTGGLSLFSAFIGDLPAGARISHAHWHATEDEMVLILSGTIILIEDGIETQLHPGDAACWRAGDPVALHAQPRRGTRALYGDRRTRTCRPRNLPRT